MPPAVASALGRHAFGWLAAANLVGVFLAALLVWPDAGRALAPLTYGRWMPLHLDWQLYGWCALPLVGALLAAYLGDAAAAGPGVLALRGWSLALAAGGASWLAGDVSGKLFLDWAGWARPLLPVAMCLLWAVIAAPAWHRRRERGPLPRMLAWSLLALLLTVPAALYRAAGPETFPAVNPASGGATGTSLLGSTLGIVTIYALLPVLLSRPRRAAAGGGAWFVPALALSWLAFGFASHDNVSHHRAGQVAALGLLAAWVPLLPVWIGRYDWRAAARPWWRAAWVWWAALVLTGWLTFLPGISERLKFTDGLVAHAHLAMAGFVTCVNVALLRQLGAAEPAAEPVAFWAWQGAGALMVGALLVAGWREGAAPGDLFLAADWTRVTYALRLAAGLVMAGVSLHWWKEAWHEGRRG